MTKRALLTDLRVKKIIKDKEYGRHHDGGGLYLVGNPYYKSFSWIQRLYRGTVTGKNRDIGLGSAELVSLAKARAKGHALRQLALEGVDPLERRRKELAEARAEASARVTFGVAMEEFLAIHSPTWRNDKHRKQWRSTLAEHASKLRSVPVSEIDAAIVNETILPLFTRTPETASRVRERILRICKWIADGRPPPISAGNGSANHHAALPYAQIPSFMPKIRARTGTSARALEFAILTAARTGEVLGARWEEIDLDEKVWVVPAGRMKGGREHVVPLSDRALELLGQRPHGGGLIFPSSRGGQMNSLSLLQVLKRLDGGADLTVHGFRSSFSDWAGDCTATPKDVVEFALAHAVKNKVEAAYRRGSAIEKRRKLMESWANYCESPHSAATVTQLRRKA